MGATGLYISNSSSEKRSPVKRSLVCSPSSTEGSIVGQSAVIVDISSVLVRYVFGSFKFVFIGVFLVVAL